MQMEITDSMGHKIECKKYSRIVSTVPSITETLFEFGLGESIVGTTRYCVYPEIAKLKTDVGGTKTLKFESIDSLNPDLIIVNKEENRRKEVEKLMEKYNVFVSYPLTLNDGVTLMEQLAKLLEVNSDPKVKSIINKAKIIINNLSNIKKYPIRTVFCPIWKDPWMSINNETYIHSVLTELNLRNVCASFKTRYPEIILGSLGYIDLVILPNEPFEFREEHIEELRSYETLKDAKYLLIDGSYLSWYGSRIIKGIPELVKLIYNETLKQE
jgi:iron complex transport system substrate-binding protein